jgi:amino acid adenylation domain-containing protein
MDLALLERLREQDVRLSLEDGTLRYDAPEGVLNPALLAELRQHRDELISFLSQAKGRVGLFDRGAGDLGPLTHAQEQLWLLEQTADPGAAYNVAVRLRIEGALPVALLRRGLDRLVAEHEALRTVIEPGPPPFQRILPSTSAYFVRLAVADEAEANSTIIRFAGEPFHLSEGPLFRALLLDRGASCWDLVLTAHHIVVDGWSLGLIAESLVATLTQASSSAAPPPARRYVDFAEWQRTHAGEDRIETALAAVRPLFSHERPAAALPADHPRPRIQSFRGGTHRLRLDSATSAGLRQLARRSEVSLSTTMFALLAVLLARVSRERSLLLGMVTANRTLTETIDLVGHFADLMPVPVDVSPDMSLTDFIRSLSTTFESLRGAQEVPFSRFVREFGSGRDPSSNPLVTTVFAFQNAPRPPLILPGCEVVLQDLDLGVAKFDLSLSVEPDGDELDLRFEFARDLFESETVERFADWYAVLAEAAPAAHDKEVLLLPLTRASAPLSYAAAAGQSNPGFSTLHQPFFAQARAAPDNLAVDDGRTQLTYSELARRSAFLAAQLKLAGIGPGDAVGVNLERDAYLLVGLLGVLLSGAAYVPLEPSSPSARLSAIRESAGVRAVLVADDDGHVGDWIGSARLVPCNKYATELAAETATFSAPPELRPASIAYIIHTSGSTGRPKGIAVPHSAAGALVTWASRRFPRADLARVLAATSIEFDISVFELFVPLAVGGCVVLRRNTLAGLTDGIAAGVTLVNTVPTVMREILDAGPSLANVLTVNLAGEPLSAELAGRVQAHAPGARLLNLYGPSETTVYATSAEVAAGAQRIVIGRPIDGTHVLVLDARLQPAPVGMIGEIAIGGEGVALGYVNQPGATAARFIPDPFGAPGARLYLTGDLGDMNSSNQITFRGRSDAQVKIDGVRVEPGEIEAVLLAHPNVRDAVVCTYRAGQAHEVQRLAGFVVLDREAPDNLSEALRRYLGERLPPAMVPAIIQPLDTLPMLPSGKSDRNALAARAAARAHSAVHTPPQTPVEALLCGIWQDALGLQRVSRDDDFFGLGGQSLAAVRVAAAVRAALGVDVTANQVFRHSVLHEFAQAVEGAQADPDAGDLQQMLDQIVSLPEATVEALLAEESNVDIRAALKLASIERDRSDDAAS